MNAIAYRFGADDLKSLAAFRDWQQLSLLSTADETWLLGRDLSADHLSRLAGLPALERFKLQEDILIPEGRQMPSGTLPAGQESSLKSFFELQIPRSANPALACKAELKLKQARTMKKTDVLICAHAQLKKICSSNLKLRWQELSYLIAGDLCLVKGAPLPSLSGDYYYFHGKLLIPSAWELNLVLPAKEWQELLELEGSYLFWQNPQDEPVLIPDSWTPLNLASLRLAELDS